MSIEIALEAGATIGESATWVAAENAVYWIDVKAPALHRFALGDGAQRRWTLTSDVGGFALTEDGGAIVALRHGVHRLDLASGDLALLAPPPFDPALFRFNEGACDAAGRFWIGVMFDPIAGDAACRPDSLYSFTLAGGLREEPDAATLHNGMAWSADGGTFFLSHSYRGEIIAFDYDADGGRLSNRRVFATVDAADGIPDGAAIDRDGGYWTALHDGGKLRRFHPNGTMDRDIAMSVRQPTMPCFAGDDMATLYVTSASDGMTAAERQAEPHAGALLRLVPGERGIARSYIVR